MNINNLSPECRDFIKMDILKHNHKNLDETMECIIKRAATVSRLITDITYMARPVGDPGKRIVVITMSELFKRLNYLFPENEREK